MICIFVILPCVIVSCLGNDGYITFLNLYPQSNGNNRLECYTPNKFTSYTLSYSRSFAVESGDNLSPKFRTLRDDHRYETGAVGMGVYQCTIVKDGVTTVVKTTKIRDDAVITPANSKNTVTVNIGDDVTITFDTDLNSNLVWRKDGDNPFISGTTEKSMTFNPVETDDAGVYEMYEDGNRDDRRHAFIKLIVRECRRHKWGPSDCIGDCEYCYNGGVCDDKTGFCICAPGFKGSTCEIECNGNQHGWECEHACSSSGPLTSCKDKQFCLPDPYGCSCVTGYKGLKCDTECSSGTFGANCAQTCHCKQNDCDRYTGICTNSSCAFPWTGTNCQKCQSGFYGDNCEIECNKPCECHRVTGKCIECFSNWLEPDCEIGILNTTFTPANNGQITTTSCSVYQTGTYDVQTIIMVINNDVTGNVTTTKQDSENSIITHRFSVSAVAGATYKCVIFKGSILAHSNITSEIFRLLLYKGNLTIFSISSTYITIEWTAWNSNTDDGDGPVVGYFLYHRLNTTDNWNDGLYKNSISGTVSELEWDTQYTFGVSAVRPGEGGDGPIGEGTVTVKTLCGTPASVQQANHDVSDCNAQSALVRWTKIKSDAETLKCYDTSYIYKVYLRLNDDDGIGDVVYSGTDSNVTIDNLSSSAYSIFVTVSNKDNESDYVKSIDTTDTIEDGKTCSCGSIIAGTLIAGVFIGVVCTVIVTQGKQRWRKNMSKSNDDSSNAQHVYTNYASNSSSSSKPSGKIVSKSEKNETNELHVYQDYANEANNAEYSTCYYHPNQESVYALPEESAYVN